MDGGCTDFDPEPAGLVFPPPKVFAHTHRLRVRLRPQSDGAPRTASAEQQCLLPPITPCNSVCRTVDSKLWKSDSGHDCELAGRARCLHHPPGEPGSKAPGQLCPPHGAMVQWAQPIISPATSACSNRTSSPGSATGSAPLAHPSPPAPWHPAEAWPWRRSLATKSG